MSNEQNVELISCKRCGAHIMANGVMLVESHKCLLPKQKEEEQWWDEEVQYFNPFKESLSSFTGRLILESRRRTLEEVIGLVEASYMMEDHRLIDKQAWNQTITVVLSRLQSLRKL